MSDQTDVQNIEAHHTRPILKLKKLQGYELYNDQVIYERHRHRYGFNNEFGKRTKWYDCFGVTLMTL